MPDHPSWPAELVEKGAKALAQGNTSIAWDVMPNRMRADFRHEAQAVLSALSGDLVPREEHERAIEEVLGDDPEKWSFRALVKVARLMLAANYPPDIFVGGGPATDSGVQFVVALRNALATVDADAALPSEVVPRSQADALAEALEEAVRVIVAWEEAETGFADSPTLIKARSALASYRSKPAPGETK